MAFLKRLRQDQVNHNPFIPVIVCTANTEKGHVSTARDLGMTNYLRKPISANMIYLAICAVIEDHRPFIHTGSFFGPQRRHKRMEPYTGVERRMSERI
jgi:DNA-binding response OmpR family regulator